MNILKELYNADVNLILSSGDTEKLTSNILNRELNFLKGISKEFFSALNLIFLQNGILPFEKREVDIAPIIRQSSKQDNIFIIAVPGYGSNKRSFLQMFKFFHNRKVDNYKISFIALPGQYDFVSIKGSAVERRNFVIELMNSLPKKRRNIFITLGHSRGCMEWGYAIKYLGLKNLIHLNIGLGGPYHKSVPIAHLGLGRSAEQLRRNFIETEFKEIYFPDNIKTVSIFCLFDFIVPVNCSVIKEKTNVTNYLLPYGGHSHLLNSKRINEVILSEISKAL